MTVAALREFVNLVNFLETWLKFPNNLTRRSKVCYDKTTVYILRAAALKLVL